MIVIFYFNMYRLKNASLHIGWSSHCLGRLCTREQHLKPKLNALRRVHFSMAGPDWRLRQDVSLIRCRLLKKIHIVTNLHFSVTYGSNFWNSKGIVSLKSQSLVSKRGCCRTPNFFCPSDQLWKCIEIFTEHVSRKTLDHQE